MAFSEVVQAISTVGFPIVMCGYFVLRFEKRMDKNTEAIDALLIHLKTRKGE